MIDDSQGEVPLFRRRRGLHLPLGFGAFIAVATRKRVVVRLRARRFGWGLEERLSTGQGRVACDIGVPGDDFVVEGDPTEDGGQQLVQRAIELNSRLSLARLEVDQLSVLYDCRLPLAAKDLLGSDSVAVKAVFEELAQQKPTPDRLPPRRFPKELDGVSVTIKRKVKMEWV